MDFYRTAASFPEPVFRERIFCEFRKPSFAAYAANGSTVDEAVVVGSVAETTGRPASSHKPAAGFAR